MGCSFGSNPPAYAKLNSFIAPIAQSYSPLRRRFRVRIPVEELKNNN
jgi:hypothetical protein